MTLKKLCIISLFLTSFIHQAHASNIIEPLQLKTEWLGANCIHTHDDYECTIQGNIYSQKKLIFSFGGFISYDNKTAHIETHHNSISKTLPAVTDIGQDYNLRLSTRVNWEEGKIGLIFEMLEPNEDETISSEILYFPIEVPKKELIPTYNFKVLAETYAGDKRKYYITGNLVNQTTQEELCSFTQYVTPGKNRLCNDFTVLEAFIDAKVTDITFFGNVGKIILEPVTKRTGLTCVSF